MTAPSERASTVVFKPTWGLGRHIFFIAANLLFLLFAKLFEDGEIFLKIQAYGNAIIILFYNYSTLHDNFTLKMFL